jgi:hypothetical protein
MCSLLGMEEKEVRLVMFQILTRLQNMRKWGGAHSELKRVVKSLPSRYTDSSQGKKIINKAIKELVNLNFIGVYKKTNEDHTSLNPRKAVEIGKFVRDVKEEFG